MALSTREQNMIAALVSAMGAQLRKERTAPRMKRSILKPLKSSTWWPSDFFRDKQPVKLCPGGHHAWFEVGGKLVRKPYCWRK